jgi:predicted nuclease of predicted toxin-antitoxin system
VKILIDMNLSPTWVEFLIANGFEAQHWSKVGDPRATDESIMRHARELLTVETDRWRGRILPLIPGIKS